MTIRMVPPVRVQIPAYTDHWRRGDHFGEVVRTYLGQPTSLRARLLTRDKYVARVEMALVRLDRSGKLVRVVLADCGVVS